MRRPVPQLIAKQFVEVLMAPAPSRPKRWPLFAAKKNTRLLQTRLADRAAMPAHWEQGRNAQDFKRVGSGLLIQSGRQPLC